MGLFFLEGTLLWVCFERKAEMCVPLCIGLGPVSQNSRAGWPVPFFPGILLSRKSPDTHRTWMVCEKERWFKRMAQESTPRKVGLLLTPVRKLINPYMGVAQPMEPGWFVKRTDG